jgi:apolipoprotein N-acyltransferase
MQSSKVAPGWLVDLTRAVSQAHVAVRVLIAIGAGCLIALAQPPFDVLPLAFLGLIISGVSFLAAQSVRQAAWIGGLCGLGYFAVLLHWMVEPFLVYPEQDGWMAPFALFFMAGGLSLFWAAAFAAARRMSSLAILCVTLTCAEALRSYALTGFPWGLLGYVWLDSPVGQLAAWIGPHGLTFFTVLLIFVPLGLVHKERSFAALATFCALGFGALILGQLQDSAPLPADRSKTVRLIQPNAPQDQKWDPEYREIFFERQLEFSRQMPAVDLIVWPETALPVLLHKADDRPAQAVAAAKGAVVILGVLRQDLWGYYNTLAVLGPTGQVLNQYDKHHLVPFGEYIPLADLFGVFASGLAKNYGEGFQAGPGPAIVGVPGIGKILPLICYEVIFPHEIGAVAERPDFMLQITNDAWFGTFSGPYQHLAQARMRAIEQGLPMLRVANTGVSAVIDAKGRLRHQLPLGVTGYLDATLPVATAPTIYSRVGDWLVLVLTLLFLICVLWIRKRFSN